MLWSLYQTYLQIQNFGDLPINHSTNPNEKTLSLSVFISKSLYSPLDTFSLLAVYYGLIYQHLNYSVEIWDMEFLEPVLPLNYRKG